MLNAQAVGRMAALFLVMVASLFGSAGTLAYWQGWIYLAVFFGASLLIVLYLSKNSPALLARRLRGGPFAEKRRSQRVIMAFLSIGFIALLVLAGLDRRFDWSDVPPWLALVGDLLAIAGFAITFLVYRENAFSSATIELAEDQKVVSTGPYAAVRHPLYAGASLYLFATPLALASYWAFLAPFCIMPFLVWRLMDEEAFLSMNLPGYVEYRRNVRYRLVPFLW